MTIQKRAWMLALTMAAMPLAGCQEGGSAAPTPGTNAPDPASAPNPAPAPEPPQAGQNPAPPPGGGGPGGGPGASSGMLPGYPPGGPGMMGGPPPGMGGPATGIKAVMRKVAAGPNSLTAKLGNQLKAESPDWDTVQAETKEYAAQAKELGTYDPPKGSKESWKELTDAFAQHAEDMDKAAQAKDKMAAIAARDQLANSCKTCHDAHQNKRGRSGFGPGGPGGPGGPPPGGGFRPPPGEGPPPGGPPPGGSKQG